MIGLFTWTNTLTPISFTCRYKVMALFRQDLVIAGHFSSMITEDDLVFPPISTQFITLWLLVRFLLCYSPVRTVMVYKHFPTISSWVDTVISSHLIGNRSRESGLGNPFQFHLIHIFLIHLDIGEYCLMHVKFWVPSRPLCDFTLCSLLFVAWRSIRFPWFLFYFYLLHIDIVLDKRVCNWFRVFIDNSYWFIKF